MTTIADRAAGAVLGALIGDALGLGPHWYYDLAELRKEYGDWIDDYVDPKPGRYHAGMQAGEIFRLESAALRHGEGQRIAQREHHGGGGSGSEIERAGFLVHGAIEANIAGATEG